MTEEELFIEELLEDADMKEEEQTEAYFDLLLLQIKQFEEKIANNFAEAEKEVKIINDWALRKNHTLHEKVGWLEKRLEAFIRERKEKTIELPHGVLKFHKKPDKVEITDMNLFLKNAPPEVLSVVPEQVKCDLTRLKNYLKSGYKPLPGASVIPGKEEFSYKLNEEKEAGDGGKKEAGTGAEQSSQLRVAV